MKKIYPILALLILGSQQLLAQAGWAYIAEDSANLLQYISNPRGVTSIAFNPNAGPATPGVYFGGSIQNAYGNYSVNFWNSRNSYWGDVGNLTANNFITSIATGDGSTNVYATGLFTDAQGSNYVASLPTQFSPWTELTSLTSPDGGILTVTTNGVDTYAAGSFETVTTTIKEKPDDTFDTTYAYHSFSLVKLQGDQWVDIGDSVINQLLFQDTTDFTQGPLVITANFAGILFVTFNGVDRRTGKSMIYTVNYEDTHDTSGGRVSHWAKVGDPQPVFSQTDAEFPNAIAVPEAGTDVYVAGNIKDQAGNYCVRHYKPTSKEWEVLGSDGFFNGPIYTLLADQTNVYAGGAFTDGTGYPFVARCTPGANDSLTKWYEMGGSMRPNGAIKSLAAGKRYLDDIYASGTFGGAYDATTSVVNFYYLAHYSNTNGLSTSMNVYNQKLVSDSIIDSLHLSIANLGYNGNIVLQFNGVPIFTDQVIGNFNPVLDKYYAVKGRAGDSITAIISGASELQTAPDTVSVRILVTALPLNFIYLKSQNSPNGVVSTWETTDEINTSYFNVQRSIDGVNFMTIGKVDAMNTSGAANNYSYDDRLSSETGSNVLFYRIQEVDIDSGTTYSHVASLEIARDPSAISLVPNPAVNSVAVLGSNIKELSIFTSTGMQVIHLVPMGAVGNVDVSILPRGIYIVRIVDLLGNLTARKLVLQ